MPFFLPCQQANCSHELQTTQSRQDSGFALVIALSLMAFILLLLLSITTLTRVESASSEIQKDKLKAKQNALLGLSLAIGELQKLAGPDTRITAPASAVADVSGHSKATGVWRSCEGRDHLISGTAPGGGPGLPIPPAYGSKLNTGDLNPESTQAGRFLAWLSSDALENDDARSPPELLQTIETIPLLSANVVGDSPDQEVHIKPTVFDDGETGSYAWWIQGENIKSQINYTEPPTNSSEWTTRLATFGASDPEVFNFLIDPKLGQITSRATLNLLPTTATLPDDLQPSGFYYHDLTANRAKGLLTNAATGGWKRDLSLMSEDWDRLPQINLPFFTLEPGIETTASKADGGARPAQMLIYPWANPVEGPAVRPRGQPGASTTWNNLVDYCLQYRKIAGASPDGRVTMNAFGGHSELSSDITNWRDKVRRFPVLVRMHWVFSYASRYEQFDPEGPSADDFYVVALDANPAFTIWNPYNFEITVDSIRVDVEQTVPFTFDFKLTSETGGAVDFGQITMREIVGDQRAGLKLLNETGGDTISLQPGETRIFSPLSNVPITGSFNELELYPGYRTSGGFRYFNLDPNSGNPRRIEGAPSDRLSAVIVMNADSVGSADNKPGIDYNWGDKQNEYLADFREWGQIDANNTQVTLTNPDPFDGPPDKLRLDNLVSNPEPFIATLVTRTSATSDPQFGKGFLRSNPLTFSAYSNQGEEITHRWKFFPLNGTNGGEGLPEASPEDHSYIGTSHQAQLGLTHMVAAEVPLRPLRSLGELQHFDITAANNQPPFVYNVLGNSHANPFFKPNTINKPDANGTRRFLSFDHSYVTNHIFFDDWFVSSIAPETNPWNGSVVRTKEAVYADHLSLEEPLPNKFYQPRLRSDVDAAAAKANEVLGEVDAWRNIASELEVEGMFNVNSTSTLAWSSLLRQLRNAQVPKINYSGSAWNVQLDSLTGGETPSSRTTVAGDDSLFIGNNPELGSFRKITESQIEALAEEIVEQIKQRGPFLSLSEFVNRQLVTGNTELARAGAIEAALIKLTESGSSTRNPNHIIQSIYITPTDSDESSQDFPAADKGYTAYGYPGWVRQADLLRALAPILSVRDDTFVIRIYGGHRHPVSGQILSEVWCEAVVQRRADYVDPSDDKTVMPSSDTLSSPVNARFGRRFEIVSMRWLSNDEI